MSDVQSLVSLDGKVALVTGAAGGIGFGTAQRLADAGANVVLTDIDKNALQEAVDRLIARGAEVDGLVSDGRDIEQGPRAVDFTKSRFGAIDILVNNAAVYLPNSALEVGEAEWDLMMNLNVRGMYFHMQAAARSMVEAGRGGRIINISSMAAYRPTVLLSVYSASKGAVVSATSALAKELGPHNITVNVILPGGTETKGAEVVIEKIIRQVGPEVFTQRSPPVLPRRGQPEDIANAVLFLASDLASYITGASLVVDGGYSL